MIDFLPDSKKALRAMIRRIEILILCIIVITIVFVYLYTGYGGIPFLTYSEALSYFIRKVWESLIEGNIILLPIRVIFLPFVFVQDCSRPGCVSMGIFFTVVYYIFWFYLTIILREIISNEN